MDKKQEYRVEITAYIVRSILGQSSVEEQEAVEAWLAESAEHRKWFESLREEVIDREHLRIYTDVAAPEKAFRLFLRRREKLEKGRRIFSGWKYVACLVLLLSIGGYCWWKFYATKEVASVQVAERGSKRLPVITLADGKEVVLCQNELKLKDVNGRQVASGDSDGLAYTGQIAGGRELEYHSLRTPSQCDYRFTLSDGTKVWVNARTTIIYPVAFGEKEREIRVDGEVYLEVAKDTASPFYVVTDDVKVRVLGTAFNVNSYADETATVVTLVEGKVAAEAGDRKITLLPDQQLSYDRQSGRTTVRKVETDIFTSWRKGEYVFRGQALREVCKVLERWYDVEVEFENPAYAQKIYTGIVYKEEKIGDFVRNLNMTSGYHCRVENGKVYIR